MRHVVHLQVFMGMDSSREVDIQEEEMFGSGSSQWVIMVIKTLHLNSKVFCI